MELTDTQVNFTRTSLWGKDLATDSWIKIDSEQLLEPIPHEYLGHMVHNSFGLKTVNKDTGSKLKQMSDSILRGKVTGEEVEKTTRLGRLGRSQVEKSRISHDYSSEMKSGKLRREISLNKNASSSWHPRNSSTVPQTISECILQRSRIPTYKSVS